jgi:hypothetical protein
VAGSFSRIAPACRIAVSLIYGFNARQGNNRKQGGKMAKRYPELEQIHRDFIAGQQVFFTASATASSRVNVTPREIGALRVVDNNTVIYLDRTGSGNETAAHMLADGRMTIMMCAFSGPPRIFRMYGRGRAINWASDEFTALIDGYYDGRLPRGTRQIMRLDIDLVQTSCGYGVPLFDYVGPREAIENWHDNKNDDELTEYWRENGVESMDGLPTGLFEGT